MVKSNDGIPPPHGSENEGAFFLFCFVFCFFFGGGGDSLNKIIPRKK